MLEYDAHATAETPMQGSCDVCVKVALTVL